MSLRARTRNLRKQSAQPIRQTFSIQCRLNFAQVHFATVSDALAMAMDDLMGTVNGWLDYVQQLSAASSWAQWQCNVSALSMTDIAHDCAKQRHNCWRINIQLLLSFIAQQIDMPYALLHTNRSHSNFETARALRCHLLGTLSRSSG